MTFYLGLTGGIASGKSTVDAYLKKLGYEVIDLDQISHEELEPGHAGWQKVKEEFGPEFIKPDQTIDRKLLGKVVFADIEELKKLNNLTHPAIEAEAQKRMEACQKPLCVVDAPLLFEAEDYKKYDATLLVDIDHDLQLKRLMDRNGLSKEQAELRISAQMPMRLKRKLADYTVTNNGSQADLEKQIDDLLAKLPLGE
jgi:dephospho-CoA kinase